MEEVTTQGVAGWLAHDGTTGNRISVRVNGIEVTSATAAQPIRYGRTTRPFGFTRALTGLWPYLDESDELTFENDGRRIPIAGHGLAYRHPGPRTRDAPELLRRVEAGWILDRNGKLKRPFVQGKRVRRYARGRDHLHGLVRDEMGLELFPIYGTLLGCVREGQFIAHDNDIDLTYISRFSEPEDVRAEFIRVCRLLTDHGYRGGVAPHAFVIRSPVECDLYPAWVRDGKLDITYGYHGTAEAWTPDLEVLEERTLGPLQVMVPRGAEQILRQIYGDSWRVPDPAFSHKVTDRGRRRASRAYHATPLEMAPIYWSQLYRRREFAQNSTFSRFVEERIAPDATIVDIGCGAGGDSTYLATRGFTVLGVDAAPEGIRQGEDRAVPGCRFVVADVGDAAALDSVLGSAEVRAAAEAGHQVVIYLRFLLHAVPPETERALLNAITRTLDDVTLAAEFRTTRDAKLPKTGRARYRRFLDSSSFVTALTKSYGFELEHFSEGTGLSVHRGEDPFLCRVIARRGEPPARHPRA